MFRLCHRISLFVPVYYLYCHSLWSCVKYMFKYDQLLLKTSAQITILLFSCLVSSDLITSVTISFTPSIVLVGDKTVVFCVAQLKEPLNASEAGFAIDYGFKINIVPTGAGTTVTNSVPIFSVNISFAGAHNCTVTVTAPGVCGGGGSEPACPTMTSDPVALMVECEFI